MTTSALLFERPQGTRPPQRNLTRSTIRAVSVLAPTVVVTLSGGGNDNSSTARPTLKRDQVVARLRTIAKYGKGWDGERACPPTKRAIDDAIDLVANLAIDIPFNAAPEPDGSVELIATGPNAKVILVIEGTGMVDVFIKKQKCDVSHAEYRIPRELGSEQALENLLRTALA